MAEDNILCLTLGCLMMKSFYCDLHYFRVLKKLFIDIFIYTIKRNTKDWYDRSNKSKTKNNTQQEKHFFQMYDVCYMFEYGDPIFYS